MSNATAEAQVSTTPASRGNLKGRIIWFMFKWFFLCPLLFVATSFMIVAEATKVGEYVSAEALEGYSWVVGQLPRTETIQLLAPDKIPIEKLIEVVSKEEGINPIITEAMALEESGGFARHDRVNEEPQLLRPWKDKNGKMHPPRIQPPSNLNDVEKTMWASSHGLLQIIYGFHKDRCNLSSFAELYDPQINLRCGLKILKENLATYANVRDQRQRVRLALRDYNGSGAQAEAYADRISANIDRLRSKSMPALFVGKF